MSLSDLLFFLLLIAVVILIWQVWKLRGSVTRNRTLIDQNNTMLLDIKDSYGQLVDRQSTWMDEEVALETRMEYEQHLILRVLNRLLSGNLQLDGDDNHIELKAEITSALSKEAHRKAA